MGRRQIEPDERAWRAGRSAALLTSAASVVGLAALVPALGVDAVVLLAIFAPIVPLSAMVVVEAVLGRLLPPADAGEGRTRRVLARQAA